ncbi:MAG: prohibitin family protein [Flavobacteriia bacterium]|nr:prohibitin family protein [Flavobacteriia bacterium]
MKNSIKSIVGVLILASISSCAVIRPGEIGIKQRFGKIVGKPIEQGVKFYNPFIGQIVRVNVRTVECLSRLTLPTQEGLNVQADISLLYHVNHDMANEVYLKYGRDYEEVIVLSNFRATAREISAKYAAKDLYATERDKVEKAIMDELKTDIEKLGFVIDAVLLKDIILPPQMVQAIQDKVNAEQAAMKMEFVILQQKKEAERLIIEAEAIKQAQNIINSSLTDKLLQYNNIEMLKSLMNSPNTKIIISDGKTTPFITTETK